MLLLRAAPDFNTLGGLCASLCARPLPDPEAAEATVHSAPGRRHTPRRSSTRHTCGHSFVTRTPPRLPTAIKSKIGQDKTEGRDKTRPLVLNVSGLIPRAPQRFEHDGT